MVFSQAGLNSLETELNQPFSFLLKKSMYFEIRIYLAQAGQESPNVDMDEPEPLIPLLPPSEHLDYSCQSPLSAGMSFLMDGLGTFRLNYANVNFAPSSVASSPLGLSC